MAHHYREKLACLVNHTKLAHHTDATSSLGYTSGCCSRSATGLFGNTAGDEHVARLLSRSRYRRNLYVSAPRKFVKQITERDVAYTFTLCQSSGT